METKTVITVLLTSGASLLVALIGVWSTLSHQRYVMHCQRIRDRYAALRAAYEAFVVQASLDLALHHTLICEGNRVDLAFEMESSRPNQAKLLMDQYWTRRQDLSRHGSQVREKADAAYATIMSLDGSAVRRSATRQKREALREAAIKMEIAQDWFNKNVPAKDGRAEKLGSELSKFHEEAASGMDAWLAEIGRELNVQEESELGRVPRFDLLA